MQAVVVSNDTIKKTEQVQDIDVLVLRNTMIDYREGKYTSHTLQFTCRQRKQ